MSHDARAVLVLCAFAVSCAAGVAPTLDDDVGPDTPPVACCVSSGGREGGAPPPPRDGGTTKDAAADAPPEVEAGEASVACGGSGTPLALQPGQWTWFDDAATRCGPGSATGYAVNPAPGAKRLVIYLMGGGACFDAASCGGYDPNHQAAHVTSGYGYQDFQQEQAQFFGQGTIFDRGAATNPFKNDTWVFVPYCTGDMHSGNAVASYGTHHVGFANMTAMLSHVAPTFCQSVDRVVLTGSSAGGWGAVFNYAQVKTAFGATRVDLVDDSGPPLGPEYFQLQDTMRAAWGSAANAPSGCSGCTTSWAAFFPFYAAQHPEARFSLIQSTEDPSVCPFFGLYDPNQCWQAIHAFYNQTMQPITNARVWLSDVRQHVWLGNVFTSAASAGVPLTTFVTKQLDDDPSWASAVP